MMRYRNAAIALVVLVVLGCGSSPKLQPRATSGSTDFTAKARRVGQSLHLDVMALRRAQPVLQAFERPELWSVEVRTSDGVLERVVNGSVEVGRTQVGGLDSNLYDTDVHFSLAFAMPEPDVRVQVVLDAPGAEQARLVVPVD